MAAGRIAIADLELLSEGKCAGTKRYIDCNRATQMLSGGGNERSCGPLTLGRIGNGDKVSEHLS